MVGINIGDTLTPTPWTPEKIEQVLSEARCSGHFECDAVKFWHCDARRILPTAEHDNIRKVMVHANNDEMLTVSDWKAWVETHLRPVVDGLRGQRVYKEIFLAVGNEALAPWHVERFGGRLVPCMKEVYTALKQTRLNDRVKMVTPLEMSILGASYPPSAGQVAEAHLGVVSELVKLLVRIGSPFCINVYPFFAREHCSQDFAIFGPNEGYLDGEGGKLRYTNMFDAQFDAVVSGISKLKGDIVGADKMDFCVTEVGWPTAESHMADKESARRFTAGVCLASTKGTPLRPGRLDVYLFELYDECQKDGAPHEKHFGLFDIDGRPK